MSRIGSFIIIYTGIRINDIQSASKIYKFMVLKLIDLPPVESIQVSRKLILSLLCLSRNVSGPKAIVT